MNYRHSYHAGNFADVIKHFLLVLCLDRFKVKDAPLFVLDAHGGCGMYDLKSTEPQKTLEYETGIAKLMAADPQDADLQLYLSLIRKDWKRRHYPGSPVIAARMLRPQDRLLANELHPQDVEILKQNMGGYNNTRVRHMDAYEAIRAHLPPPERRGLVLIDPPFEIEKNEFGILEGQLQEWKRRWETGTFLIWYPIKPHQPVQEFYDAVIASGFKDIWLCEYKADLPPAPDKPNRLVKTGVMLLNAPYQVPERFEQALKPVLGVMGGQMACRWLMPPS